MPRQPEAGPPALPGGLVYVTDEMPGIRRVRREGGFDYVDADGRPLRDEAELARIRRLAIPPAYESVWICPLPQGHLQATGRDARGRKQYRYHPEWRALREQHKFDRLAEFGRALPRLRERVALDLRRRGGSALPRERVLAALVRLLDTTWLRVGNEEYARGNGSYGLTTLRNRHAGVRGSRLMLRFRGKSGVMQQALIDDPIVARIVRHCQQLPGQALFEFREADGRVHAIGSGDVNDYITEAAGARFTAKDFRTWHGTVQALALARAESGGRSARELLAEVARRLGNTVAVCRKSYVHPLVLELLAQPEEARGRTARAPRRRGLSEDERRLLGLLEPLRPSSRRAPAASRAHAARGSPASAHRAPGPGAR